MNSLVPVFCFPKRTQSPEILGDLSESIQLIKKGASAKLALCGPLLPRRVIWEGLWGTTFRAPLLSMQVGQGTVCLRRCHSRGLWWPSPREEDMLAERRIYIDKTVGHFHSLWRSSFQRLALSVRSTLGWSIPARSYVFVSYRPGIALKKKSLKTGFTVRR